MMKKIEKGKGSSQQVSYIEYPGVKVRTNEAAIVVIGVLGGQFAIERC